MKIIAPWRTWEFKSREDEIEYAEKHNIPLKINRETNYSKDKNLWHLSHEGLDLEDPANEPQYNKKGFLELGVSPEQAPDKAEYVTISFEKGVPTKLNGEAIDSVELIKELNKIGGRNGVGITDIVENRLVGMKARGVYETPGGTILYAAHATSLRKSALTRIHFTTRRTFQTHLQNSFMTANGTHLSVRLSRHSLTAHRSM